ncbi:hypothetical protein [Maritalea porphyrae]|uniref:AbiU2 domain-containing protein n=1 Tax=Maritalea porphyrae TaxID=880732 RepID=UPI0022AE7D64|nr:hypothetical protein [Maritalea porphyrae]MCZ4274096.1 hypothetical protein [Maritalea porphyrae]
MHTEESLREIAKMSAAERWIVAKEKLSNTSNRGAVSALLNHLPVHENTRWLIFQPQLANQVATSSAAHAFRSLQISNLHYELIRICTFWDPVDLDSYSIPTIVALADDPSVSLCVYEDHFSRWPNEPVWAKEQGNKARRRLRNSIRDAKKVENSDVLRSARNYRDKLAHLLEQTRAEKKETIPPPKYGDERKLLEKTISAVNRLYLSLNGVNFDWKGAKKMHRRNADSFWKGVSIEVLR